MKKDINDEKWLNDLYKLAKLEFRLDLLASEKMSARREHNMQVYLQTGEIIKDEDQPDYVAIAKAKALRIAFEKLSDKEKHREEFNRDFKSILYNFTSVTPCGAVVGE